MKKYTVFPWMAGLVWGFEFTVSNVKDMIIFKCSSGFVWVSFEEHAPCLLVPSGRSRLHRPVRVTGLVRDPLHQRLLTRGGPEGRSPAGCATGRCGPCGELASDFLVLACWGD